MELHLVPYNKLLSLELQQKNSDRWFKISEAMGWK